MPSYRQAGKLALFPDSIGFPADDAKEIIWDQFLIYILKHPEYSVIISVSSSCPCLLSLETTVIALSMQ